MYTNTFDWIFLYEGPIYVNDVKRWTNDNGELFLVVWTYLDMVTRQMFLN